MTRSRYTQAPLSLCSLHSKLAKANRPDLDNLTADFPHTCWRAQIEHAKKIGLGEDTYELITV